MEYKISYKDPHKHFADIELLVDKINSPKLFIQLPSWRPGRYEMQNYSRNIQKLEISDESGNKIPWKKVSRDRWEAETVGLSKIIIKYNYYCYQMDAGGSWLDENQLYLNFINCALYIIGKELEPCNVSLEIPDSYQIACGLPKEGKMLMASDYYHLVDAPMIASPDLQKKSYQTQGVDFNIWILGNLQPNWDLILNNFQKLTEENFNVFGEFPEKDYHFIYQILPFPHYHGVEHRNSTVITLGPDEQFYSKELYEGFLGVSCHELFHAWNALKIRPKELLPYNFTRENYFRSGYVIEGVTTYYGDLLLARSGVFSQEQYFFELNNVFKKHFDNFGRHNLSLAESSFDLWVDGYVAGIPNRKVSIYGKGAIAALILDLELRKTTQNTKSLDDVMRLMWLEFGKKHKGYTEEDYEHAVNTVAGTSFRNYFQECIHGTVDLQGRLNEAFYTIGCELSVHPNPRISEKVFGFRTIQRDIKTFVDFTEPDSPGDKVLTKEDEIISLDGVIPENNLCELLHQKVTVEIVFKRFGKTYTKTLKADQKNYLNEYRISKRENASDEDKLNFKKWLNTNF